MPSGPLVPTAIFVSGAGTNLQAVIDAARDERLPIDIKLVVSDNARAFALERARAAGVPARVIPWDRQAQTRAAYAAHLARAVRDSGARLVLLLGWMHVLDAAFLDAGFEGVLNLHPSYLPDDPSADTVTLPDGTSSPVFRGAHALRDAMRANVPVTGATLIEITPHVDRGPVVARRTFALRAGEDEAVALARLHEVEQAVVLEGVNAWIGRRKQAATR